MRAPKRIDPLSMRWDYYLSVRCAACGRSAGARVSQWAKATATSEHQTLDRLTQRMYCAGCKGRDLRFDISDDGRCFRAKGEACLAECPPRSIIRLACARCDRRGQYRRETLADRYGIWAGLSGMRMELASCPKTGNASEPCGASFVPPLPWMRGA